MPLHFHLSSDKMALAGARKANALAWKRGNLNTREAQFRCTDCEKGYINYINL